MSQVKESSEEVIPGCVSLIRGFLPESLAKRLFKVLEQTIAWRQESITFKGNVIVPMPRLTAWYGDPGARYFYSGIQNEPLPWTTELYALRIFCESAFGGESFLNSCLLNFYRSGSDSIGYHTDNENDLVERSLIATISLGGPRTFHLRSRHDKRDVRKVVIENGSLLVMHDNCQQDWLHGIPKEPELTEPRISATFRTIKIASP